MHPSELLRDYGYYAVFFLGLLEGETILLLGAYAVRQHYLHILPLIACGASAAFISDQFYFYLGRRKGTQVLETHPKLRARFGKAFAFVERHPIWTIMLMRFAWGLRIAFPVALGMTKMRPAVFLPLNAFAAVLWATIVSYFGIFVTEMAHRFVGRLRPYEHWVIVIALLLGLWVAIRHIKME